MTDDETTEETAEFEDIVLPQGLPADANAPPLRIYLIAGEASGDLLGAHLMRALKKKFDVAPLFYGVGGEKMAAEGLKSLFPYYELSMMGFIEILPYAYNIYTRITQTVEDINAKRPDVVITIDSPGFCFRVVKKLRKEKLATKFIHYVAPSVWVYKPERAAKCAALFDHLLTLLPFEPPYFKKAGLPATWVGHPAVAETVNGDGTAFRQRYKLAENTRLFMLFPGSRKGEVERHMPIFAQAVSILATQYRDFAIVVAVPKNVLKFVTPYFEKCPFRAIVTANEQDKKDAIAASNLAIVKSGTVALEVAKGGTPMIVTYRVNALTAWAFRRMRLIKLVNLVNILLKKEIIPELLQALCHPLLIASAASQLLENKARREYQLEQCRIALQQLVPPDGRLPSDIAADVVRKIVKK